MSILYLNRFIGEAWPFAAGLLENEIIHGAKVEADKQGLDLHVGETTLDLRATPRFALAGTQLKLRLPGAGSYHFKGRVEKHLSFLPNPEITVYLSIWAEMTFGSGAPLIDIHVAAEGDWLGDIVDWFNDWESELETQIKAQFAEHLGFFSSARYDPVVAVPAVVPELLHGYPELDKSKALDIMLVSDGFTTDKLPDFAFLAAAFSTKLTTFADSRVNEPFLSFDSAIRIWQLRVPSVNATSVSHRVVARYLDGVSGTYKTALANLARLATIGEQAEAVGANVLVFLTDRTTLGGAARAMTMGGLIMLPVLRTSTPANISTLIHELGHTPLGGLRDEYVTYELAYRGNEPKAPNITGQSPNTDRTHPTKWANWARNPGKLPTWDRQPITSVEGAGEYQLKLWRPAAVCKMRDSTGEVAFCAVCREALTRGIRQALGPDFFLLETANLSAGTVRQVQIGQADAFRYRLRTPEQGETQFRIKFLAASLPKPWRITFQTTGGIIRGRYDADECFLTASFGDVLTVVVESQCPFTPWDVLPQRTIQLHFDLPLRTVPQAAPTVPVDLTAIGSTDRVGHPVTVQFSATSSDPNADNVRFAFEMVAHSDEFTGRNTMLSEWLRWTPAHPNVRGYAERIVRAGGYKFRVRAEDETGRFSGWSPPKPFVVLGDIDDGR